MYKINVIKTKDYKFNIYFNNKFIIRTNDKDVKNETIKNFEKLNRMYKFRKEEENKMNKIIHKIEEEIKYSSSSKTDEYYIYFFDASPKTFTIRITKGFKHIFSLNLNNNTSYKFKKYIIERYADEDGKIFLKDLSLLKDDIEGFGFVYNHKLWDLYNFIENYN